MPRPVGLWYTDAEREGQMIKVMQADITTDIAQSESRSGAMKNLAVSFMLSVVKVFAAREVVLDKDYLAADRLDFRSAAAKRD